MSWGKLFQEVSLAGTFTSVAIGVLVSIIWAPSAIRAILKDSKTHEDWLIIGVWLGFICGSLDSVFWEIPWSLSYIESEYFSYWVGIGVFFNVPFRQAGDIVSGALHVISYGALLRSLGRYDTATPLLVKVASGATIAGVFYVIFLRSI